MDIMSLAGDALSQMQTEFDAAQVSLTVSEQDELNIANDEASLLRSTEDYALALTGIREGRKATAALTDLSSGAVSDAIRQLAERTASAPVDEANAVSGGERGAYQQGPLESDLTLLTAKVRELMAWREENTPSMHIEEGGATHICSRNALLTSDGTELTSTTGCYSLMALGTATEGERGSSMNYAGGVTNDLTGAHASEMFGIGDMMRETERQIETVAFGEKTVGDIIMAPSAVEDLLFWLLGQLSDGALIANASVYRDRVEDRIASPLLTLRSRFDGPGEAPYSGDGFVTPEITVVSDGALNCLLPSLYGSLKTGITHVPTADGWQISPGSESREELISNAQKGALVTRFSMGSPGPNGDFSGVIKNSFKIQGGELGQALTETMVSGNMASMLLDITGISQEVLDYGDMSLPWIRVSGLHFS